MHVLLCTVFINVYGQGLALRGPIGSMVRAVNGMVDETNQILIAYVLTILFFTLSTVGVYWIMFPADAAIVSSVITLAGLYMWYHYVLRIYNRFQWNQDLNDSKFPKYIRVCAYHIRPYIAKLVLTFIFVPHYN